MKPEALEPRMKCVICDVIMTEIPCTFKCHRRNPHKHYKCTSPHPSTPIVVTNKVKGAHDV